MQGVLFDLDGTLLDTAPDMVPVLNRLRAEAGLSAVPFAAARPYVSNGSAGLVRIGFPGADSGQRAQLQARFLELYAMDLCHSTRLFPGLDQLLDDLERRGVPWGVVTNKPAALTEPLLQRLGLRTRCACVVSGDTLLERKPHPAPVTFAVRSIGAAVDRVAYVGDARRDIESGRAAGTRTIAVTYGYIPPEEDPATWGADAVVSSAALLATALARVLD